MSERNAVYRLFAADDTLLYVGVAKSFGVRWDQHAKAQPWWPLVDHQTVNWYPSREEAEVTEKQAIRTERPVYNIAGSPWEGGMMTDGTGFYVIPRRGRESHHPVDACPLPAANRPLIDKSTAAGIAGRVERYRAVARLALPPCTYTIATVRICAGVDNAGSPHEAPFAGAMDAAAEALCGKMSGAAFTYVQSCEISVLLSDFHSERDRPWLDGDIVKMTTAAATTATAEFNYAALSAGMPGTRETRAVFDASIFTVPSRGEAGAYFAWRQRACVHGSGIDWTRHPGGVKRGRVCEPIPYEVKVPYTNYRGKEYVRTDVRYRWLTSAAPWFAVDSGAWLAKIIPPMPDALAA